MKVTPKFFCETCGREVSIDVDECPYCGRHFYGVMCPRCGKSGPAAIFQNGCPRCGYRTVEGSRGSSAIPVEGHVPPWSSPSGASEIKRSRDRGEAARKKPSLWGPLLAILLLATMCAAIVLHLL